MLLNKRRFDVLIIGAGGASLNAAIQLANAEARVAVVSKVVPTRSHTVAAHGGVNAALANVHPDNWHWHMFDTVKSSDYLGDQAAIEFMCREAIPTVYELEHQGVPFSRLANGKIYQRALGGQTQEFGGVQAVRACAAADRTGHAILHTLYQQNLRVCTQFLDEYFAIELIRDDEGAILGALTLEMATGEPWLLEAKATLLATGGCGQVYRTTSNAHINTGDGMAMALRVGIPLMDMEFYQFHPTGIAGRGVLITEGVRGEGGYLVNKDGERFMAHYAPKAEDLASRDLVSRAIVTEVREGRGAGPDADHVWLKLDHLGEDRIAERLPGVRQSGQIFAGVDVVFEPLPVHPTAHYLMGGIPTDSSGRVTAPSGAGDDPVPGLYAAGECACVSVHGANRLGGNSLLDGLVFGRAAGLDVIEYLEKNPKHRPLSATSVERAMVRLKRWDRRGEGISVRELRDELRQVMEEHTGVYRTQATLVRGAGRLSDIRDKLEGARLTDHSKAFNTARVEALELENLIDVGIAITRSALQRQESRGAHARLDYPLRDDVNWLKHSLYYQADDRMDCKPVQTQPLTVAGFTPKERLY